MKQIVLSLVSLSCVYGAYAQSSKKLEAVGDTINLEEVSVLGVRASKTTPMSYTTIDNKTLKKSNLGQDLPYLLQLQPSIVATSDAGTGIGYTSIRVRGVDATGVNIMANGVPINDSESQAVFWVNMPDFASSTQEMQVQRGVGTSSNGAPAFGASINMRTDNLSQDAYAEVGASAGSFGTFRRNVRLGTGRIGGHWAMDARLSKIDSKGYVDRGTVDLSSYFIQGGYFGERTSIRLLSFGGKEKTGIAWDGIDKQTEEANGRTYNSAGRINPKSPLSEARYYHNTDNYEQQHYHLYLTHKPSQSLSLSLTGHYTKGFGFTDEYRTKRKYVKFGLPKFVDASGKTIDATSLIRRKYLDNDFYGIVASANWRHGRWDVHAGAIANNYEGKHYGEIRWIERSLHPVHPEDRYYENAGQKQEVSGYLKANYQIATALSAYADIQYRHINYSILGSGDRYDDSKKALQQIDLKKTFDFVNPKMGLHYQINPYHYTYISAAVAHREPNRSLYTDVTPKDYPRHERMIDYELGYGYKGERISASANLYYMDYTDQLVLNGKTSDVGEALKENVARSYRMGIELVAGIKLLDWLRFDGSCTLSSNRIKDYTHHFFTDDYTSVVSKHYRDVQISYSPAVIASGMLTLAHSGIEGSVISQYVGMQYLDNTMSVERSLPAYHTLSLRLGYDAPWFKERMKGWRLSLQVNNLLDAKYASNGYTEAVINASGGEVSHIGYFPQAGINFLLGTTITL